MPRKKGRAGKAEKLRRESVKGFGRAAGGVARGSKEHVRKAKERIWRYTEALAWKSLEFEISCGSRIPRNYNNIHESMEFENKCCHKSSFPRGRWECACGEKALPYSELHKEDCGD